MFISNFSIADKSLSIALVVVKVDLDFVTVDLVVKVASKGAVLQVLIQIRSKVISKSVKASTLDFHHR